MSPAILGNTFQAAILESENATKVLVNDELAFMPMFPIEFPDAMLAALTVPNLPDPVIDDDDDL